MHVLPAQRRNCACSLQGQDEVASFYCVQGARPDESGLFRIIVPHAPQPALGTVAIVSEHQPYRYLDPIIVGSTELQKPRQLAYQQRVDGQGSGCHQYLGDSRRASLPDR